MPNTATNAFKTSVLKTCKVPEPGDPDKADEGDELPMLASATELGTPVKDYFGWRCSYRRDEPERPREDVILRWLRFKHKHFDNLAFGEASRSALAPRQLSDAREMQRARQATRRAADKRARM